jgi:hypothetical protein
VKVVVVKARELVVEAWEVVVVTAWEGVMEACKVVVEARKVVVMKAWEVVVEACKVVAEVGILFAKAWDALGETVLVVAAAQLVAVSGRSHCYRERFLPVRPLPRLVHSILRSPTVQTKGAYHRHLQRLVHRIQRYHLHLHRLVHRNLHPPGV